MPTPRQFFYLTFSSKEFGYVLFVSETTVDAIKANIDVSKRRYLIDATFKVVPEGPYYQFLGNLRGIRTEGRFFSFLLVQCTFALMSCKKTACYSHLFNRIHTDILPLHCAAVTDYERALRKALKDVIGADTEYIGCWFHYTQAVRKHSMQARLSKSFAQNKELKSLYHRLLCLPLLPVIEIDVAFALLKKKFLLIGNAVVEKFVVDYFEKQWMQRVSYLFIILLIFS